jgi:hypothetical protein
MARRACLEVPQASLQPCRGASHATAHHSRSMQALHMPLCVVTCPYPLANQLVLYCQSYAGQCAV